MMETKYGIISDIHDDPRKVVPAIDLLRENGAQKLVLNGDIQQKCSSLRETQDFLAFILLNAGRSGLETYVQPGSHEFLAAFVPVVEHFAEKFDNIFTVTGASRIEAPDHHAVFLPGSNVNAAGGEFKLGMDLHTGTYMILSDGLLPVAEAQEVPDIQKRLQGFLRYQNIDDLRECVKDPEKTIVFCHVPRKFDNLEEAVDMDYFGVATEQFSVSIVHYKGGEVQLGSILKPKPVEGMSTEQFDEGQMLHHNAAKLLIESGYPVALRKMNRGNAHLRSIYEELGIKKAVSGHFHESSHRANDCCGRHVNEGEFVDELFWNSGCLDIGCTGILTVRDGKVSYQNLRVE